MTRKHGITLLIRQQVEHLHGAGGRQALDHRQRMIVDKNRLHLQLAPRTVLDLPATDGTEPTVSGNREQPSRRWLVPRHKTRQRPQCSRECFRREIHRQFSVRYAATKERENLGDVPIVELVEGLGIRARCDQQFDIRPLATQAHKTL